MSLVDSLGWPTLNSTHYTPLDLHLLCSLAANRAGYSGMDLSSTPRAGNIRCSVVRPAEPERDLPRRTCKEILVGFKVLVDGEGVRVSEVNKGKLGAESHRAHREVAVPLSIESPPFAVKEGEPVHGWISVHLLEGSLRAAARLEGHHLKRTTKTSKKDDVLTISFLCEEGASKCRYVVRIESEILGDGEDGEDETRFRVKKVVGKHSCGASVEEPEKKLKTVLEAWPKVTLGSPYRNTSANNSPTMAKSKLNPKPVPRPQQLERKPKPHLPDFYPLPYPADAHLSASKRKREASTEEDAEVKEGGGKGKKVKKEGIDEEEAAEMQEARQEKKKGKSKG